MMQSFGSLPDKQKLQKKDQIRYVHEISKKSVFPWLTHALSDWAVIAASLCIAGISHNPFIYFITALIIGNRQHALAVLGHDGAHFTIHESRKVNDLLANLFCFWPLLLTAEGYRALHLTHHKNTGTAEDPELMHKRARAPQWDIPVTGRKLFLYAVKDLFGYSIPDLIIILTFSQPEKKSLLMPAIAMHAAATMSLIICGLWWVPALWYASMATSFMMFFRLRLWLEHQGTADTQRVQLNWWQGHILAPHNAWLHWEHHKWPTVPYHQLEKARKLAEYPQPLSIKQLAALLKNAAPADSGEPLKNLMHEPAKGRFPSRHKQPRAA